MYSYVCTDVSLLIMYIELARTIYMRCIYGTFGRGVFKNIRSYTVYIYNSGQPYIYNMHAQQKRWEFWPNLLANHQ
jgi:hypothetical protein